MCPFRFFSFLTLKRCRLWVCLSFGFFTSKRELTRKQYAVLMERVFRREASNKDTVVNKNDIATLEKEISIDIAELRRDVAAFKDDLYGKLFGSDHGNEDNLDDDDHDEDDDDEVAEDCPLKRRSTGYGRQFEAEAPLFSDINELQDKVKNMAKQQQDRLHHVSWGEADSQALGAETVKPPIKSRRKISEMVLDEEAAKRRAVLEKVGRKWSLSTFGRHFRPGEDGPSYAEINALRDKVVQDETEAVAAVAEQPQYSKDVDENCDQEAAKRRAI